MSFHPVQNFSTQEGLADYLHGLKTETLAFADQVVERHVNQHLGGLGKLNEFGQMLRRVTVDLAGNAHKAVKVLGGAFKEVVKYESGKRSTSAKSFKQRVSSQCRQAVRSIINSEYRTLSEGIHKAFQKNPPWLVSIQHRIAQALPDPVEASFGTPLNYVLLQVSHLVEARVKEQARIVTESHSSGWGSTVGQAALVTAYRRRYDSLEVCIAVINALGAKPEKLRPAKVRWIPY